ncbi:EamA-like transporter family protein [Roseovarius marisflavi]|uniref:EamA-like transporter family protein n=1 Tax=Roseovarius marisflavi TaxID=1054996 RepID=A0A1M7BGJ3_9RHOB|nr:DMT family transporter [Roseovarius marisflavi]SHL54061.1 EamA-like transporter family protein [Roseovarius marisflavi]
MTRHPLFGLALAMFGALTLTPDALFMRLSEMGGYQMVAWRGLLMGTVMLVLWALTSQTRRRDLAVLASGYGALILVCQYLNATLFSLGIAHAPVSIVLFSVATVPVFAALFARLIIKEPTRPATWVTIAVVMAGIALAVFGGEGARVGLDRAALLGALAGLGVAMVLAMNFVILRAQPQIPILLVIGLGALIAGATGATITGSGAMMQGQVWAIAICGLVILPVSFFSLSLASRYTHASNVSLMLLLETVLGPLWVWLGIGEAPTPLMLLGGAVVVVSLAIYLWFSGRRAAARAAE